MRHNFWLLVIGYWLLSSCNAPNAPIDTATVEVPCADALIAYAEQYPEAEPTDLYKLVFQDLYGPGHLITDSASCYQYIEREVREQCINEVTQFPLYEYTLCDSNFVRVNLYLVRWGNISLEQLVSAVLRSAEGLPQPDSKFVMTHSDSFKKTYAPHYRIVRRDIFESELLPLILPLEQR